MFSGAEFTALCDCVAGVCCSGWEKLYVVVTADALLFYKDQKHAKAVSHSLLLLLVLLNYHLLTFHVIILSITLFIAFSMYC